jgi:hypothetical protein
VLAVGWTAYLLNLAETKEHPLERSFRVAPELLRTADTVVSKTDGKTYRFVRLTAEHVPKEAAFMRLAPPSEGTRPSGELQLERVEAKDGNYLVDEATSEARFFRQDGIGTGRVPAPQSRLMAVVIDGLLTRKLPWDLIFLGVAIALFIELMGFRSLTFAVGVYLPLSSTMPVFLGGLVRKIADLRYRREPDAEDEPEGTLYCSGLIAGASILGIFAAMQAFLPGYDGDTGLHPSLALLSGLPFAGSDLFGLAVITLLAVLMFRGASPPRRRAIDV